MVGAVTVVGTVAGVLSLFLGFIYYVNSNRPTAAEISNAVNRRFPQNQNVGTDLQVARVVNSHVVKNDDWLDQYDDADEQRIRCYLKGVFVGKAEVTLHFQKPPISPPQDKLEEHPYYGEELNFEGKRKGTGPLEIKATNESLILNFGVYAETVEDGAGAVAGMVNVVSKMVDQLIEEQVLEDPNEVPSIDELFSGERFEDGTEPVVSISEIPDLDDLEDSEPE